MFDHEDRLRALDENLPLGRKLEALHAEIGRRFPFVARLAVAVFDPKRRVLKTFLSSGGDRALQRYEARLEDAPMLEQILETGRPRVVNDLRLFAGGAHEHTKAIARQGYGAGYTTPVRVNGAFWGFVFMNSVATGCFTEEALAELDVFAHLAASVVAAEVLAARVLIAAVRTAHSMVHLRDPETGAHLDRMAEYSRVIAQELAARGKAEFDDEAIERLHLFAPLHDLGKIGIPDRVLLKGAALTLEEREQMRTHAAKGLEMIDRIAANFGLEQVSGIEILKAVAGAHHEAIDGSGYPAGLKGEAIPIEARIVAAADVFDALTSRRPYKEPWPNDEAFAFLRRLAAEKLDGDCVEALIRNRGRVEMIQEQFREDPAAGNARAS
ncbi:MAG: HD domain-containing protein [Planctomycetes bacterium]|nr:HD domain-containing protein [Planctomycetota bacterium]